LNVEASRCLVIEDSQAGIQAAIKAEMAVIGLGPEDRVEAAHAVQKNLSKVHLSDLEAVYSDWFSGRKMKGPFQISSAKWIPKRSKFHLPLDS
jgi:kojibiose phosphorylase